jgi:hypothetical protein
VNGFAYPAAPTVRKAGGRRFAIDAGVRGGRLRQDDTYSQILAQGWVDAVRKLSVVQRGVRSRELPPPQLETAWVMSHP